jgi:DNA ligase-1
MDKLDYIYDAIEEIGSTTKLTEKAEILSRYKNDKLFQLVLIMTYDYRLQYKIKSEQLKKITLTYKPLTPLTVKDVFKLLNKFAQKSGVNKQDKEQLAIMLNIMSEKTRNVFYKIIDKDLACGISIKTINKVFDGLIEEFAVMLAEPTSQIKKFLEITDDIFVNIKLDGVRCLAEYKNGKLTLWSRDGRTYNLEHLSNQIKHLIEVYKTKYNFTSVMFDGEITSDINDFQDLMKVVRRENIKQEHFEKLKKLKYNIFDVIFDNQYDVELKHRVKQLEDIKKYNTSKNITFVKYDTLEDENKNVDYIMKLMHEAVNDGYEGLVLKDKNSYYIKKRSISWLKVKLTDTLDAVVTKIIEGTGKYNNMIGALECRLENGIEFRVGSGLTDRQRFEWYNDPNKIIGKVIEIKYQELTNDGVPRHPIFKQVRIDKN